MKIRITPAPLRGTVASVSSKSHVHRLLIAAALADRETEIELNIWSQDMEATARCLKALGATIDGPKDGLVRVRPITPHPVDDILLPCGESGSTLRFLLPVAGALNRGKIAFSGDGKLPRRPLAPLREQMQEHSIRFDREVLPFTMSGRLCGGFFTLPGNISSQFITGLLFAASLLDQDSRIFLTTPLESKRYVSMTIETLAQFGIHIAEESSGYSIAAGQRYISPGRANTEGDWSNAAFWLAAGALSGDVTCTDLAFDSAQGDRAIILLLQEIGANISCVNGTATAGRGHLHPTTIDAADIPDLVPVLAVLACAVKGSTYIRHAARLRLKECDRLSAMAENLTLLGAAVEELPDGLAIHGNGSLHGATVSGCGDHRIVMAMTIASLLCEEPIIIEGAEAVEKSYPHFFEDFAKLGGIADVL